MHPKILLEELFLHIMKNKVKEKENIWISSKWKLKLHVFPENYFYISNRSWRIQLWKVNCGSVFDLVRSKITELSNYSISPYFWEWQTVRNISYDNDYAFSMEHYLKNKSTLVMLNNWINYYIINLRLYLLFFS